MSIQFDQYEGKSISRLSRLFALPGQAPIGHARPRRPLTAMIGDAVNGLFDRIEFAASRRDGRELDSYLAGSTDLAEIERRMRELERRQISGLHGT